MSKVNSLEPDLTTGFRGWPRLTGNNQSQNMARNIGWTRKWTIMDQSGRSWVKVDVPWLLNWTVQSSQSGRSLFQLDSVKVLKMRVSEMDVQFFYRLLSSLLAVHSWPDSKYGIDLWSNGNLNLKMSFIII